MCLKCKAEQMFYTLLHPSTYPKVVVSHELPFTHDAPTSAQCPLSHSHSHSFSSESPNRGSGGNGPLKQQPSTRVGRYDSEVKEKERVHRQRHKNHPGPPKKNVKHVGAYSLHRVLMLHHHAALYVLYVEPGV
jgi:hypothetical protein